MATGVSAPSGLPSKPEVPWGAHLCQFYRTGAELAETLVSFFRAGLANNERCVWLTCDPLASDAARQALFEAFPDAARLEREGSLTILDHSQWYLKSGGLTPDETVASWLALEEEALRAGFSGLRVSGNVRWLDTKDWDAFREYEAHVHEAFHGRRIIALCSYSLDRCGPEDVLDVLRNHGSALVRRDGQWELTDAATRVMAMVDDPALSARHGVQLLGAGAFPAARIARFLSRGFQHGESAVAIATADHLTSLVRAWERDRVDVGAAMDAERLFLIDGEGALAGFMRGGSPEPSLFASVVGSVLTRLGMGGRRIRAYGEMVDMLCLRGELPAALQLEDLWNSVLARLPLRLLCGYSVSNFDGDDGLERFHAVCDRHEHVEPSRETPERRRLSNEELLRLQTVTASLSQAASADEIGRVVITEIARSIGADAASIAVPDAAGGLRILAEGDGTMASEAAILPAMRHVYETGAPAWDAEDGVAVCLPLNFGGRTLGVMRLGFDVDREFAAMERALLFDLARQVGGALERVRLSDAATAGEARAEEADRRRHQFLGLLAHELRNPLSSMTMALQLMKARPDGDLGLERALLERQVGVLGRVVEDVADLSRIGQGTLEVRRRLVDLRGVVAEAVELARPFLDRREHVLTVEGPADAVPVDADPGRLAQAITNLLANAAKYTDMRGRISLRVTRDAGDVVIAVRDNGSGISAAALPKVFDVLGHGGSDGHRSHGGAVFGLAVVKTIVELHGGRVGASSEGPGRGSEFFIRLAAAERPPSGSATASLPEARRVLIVDDHADGADALAEMLRMYGHASEAVYDPATALARAAGSAFDVVILDINLPIMSGYELARRLRELEGTAEAHFVALTGLDSERDQARSFDEGFVAHLVKPVDGAALQEILRRSGGAAL